MSEKIIGYALLIAGITVIAGAAVSALMVFSGKIEPVQFIPQNVPLKLSLSLPADNGKAMPVPVEFAQLPIFKVLNGGIHLLLMGFLASAGYKLAMIGTSLIRPIVVKGKEM